MTDTDTVRRHLPTIGIVVTALYATGVALYIIGTGRNLAELQLNELGDFAAGISSPLAFLWLVLGFFQQGREIRLSGEALQLQAKELRASLDRQSAAVEKAAERGEAKADASKREGA